MLKDFVLQAEEASMKLGLEQEDIIETINKAFRERQHPSAPRSVNE